MRGLLSRASLIDLSRSGLRAPTGDFTVLFSLDVFLGVVTVFLVAERLEDFELGDNLDFSLREAARLSNSFSALDFSGDFPAPLMVRG